MDKGILQDYIDACALVKETEEDIRRLRSKKRIVQDSVKGSMQEFPYAPQNFHIEGSREEPGDLSILQEEEKVLEERKALAESIKMQVEQWMLEIPARMQRIVIWKVFQDMSWEQVAVKLGGMATGDSVRKEFERFLRKI